MHCVEDGVFTGPGLMCCVFRGGGGGFERGAATATALRIRIIDLEAGAGESVGVIDDGIAQIAGAFRVDEDLHAIARDDLVAFLSVVERHAVLHAGAAALLDENAEAFAGLAGMFLHEDVELLNGVICNGDHLMPLKYRIVGVKSNGGKRGEDKCGFAGLVASRPEVTIHQRFALQISGFAGLCRMAPGDRDPPTLRVGLLPSKTLTVSQECKML